MEALPKLYTPEEAAARLGITYNGKPNKEYILKAIRNGELEYIKYSPKYIRITEQALLEYQEGKICREQTKDCKSKREKIRVYGVSANTDTGIDIGTLAASRASETLKKNLQSLQANMPADNVVSLKQ